jgi:hypothetical protein
VVYQPRYYCGSMIHTERKRGPHNSGADGQAIEVARGQSTHKCRR